MTKPAILLADDARQALSLMLLDSVCQVATAASPAEALSLPHQQCPERVLLDMSYRRDVRVRRN
jgi:CheY-like chemotaxis protein